jgi:hypothetical protein
VSNKPLELTKQPYHPLLTAGGRVRLYTVNLYPNPTAPLTPYPKSGRESPVAAKSHLHQHVALPHLQHLAQHFARLHHAHLWAPMKLQKQRARELRAQLAS